MSLEVQRNHVEQVILGPGTELNGRTLQICPDEIARELAGLDPLIENLHIEIARPGDSTRIVCVKDVIEPRYRISGAGPANGTIRVLNNVAVVTCGPIVGFQEGIIDMAGTGAKYSPFSSKLLVVLQIKVAANCDQHTHERIVREAGSKLAEWLAIRAVDSEPDTTSVIDWTREGIDGDLPRIAYVYMMLSQGLLHDTYVEGANAIDCLPRFIDPRTGMTGGVVSGNCVSACDKNTTYSHQNNPVIAELLRGHGTRWNLVGVVATNEPTRLQHKQQSAKRTIELVRELNADGAIITKEGFGNPDADLMLIVSGLETAGIRTTVITDEFAGPDGSSQSLADTAPQATAVVSVGNANQPLVLPAVENTIGPLPDVSRLAGGYPYSVHQDGSLEIELQAIIGATNQLGAGLLSCREV